MRKHRLARVTERVDNSERRREISHRGKAGGRGCEGGGLLIGARENTDWGRCGGKRQRVLLKERWSGARRKNNRMIQREGREKKENNLWPRTALLWRDYWGHSGLSLAEFTHKHTHTHFSVCVRVHKRSEDGQMFSFERFPWSRLPSENICSSQVYKYNTHTHRHTLISPSSLITPVITNGQWRH